MGCVQCKDKEAAKLTDDRETSVSHNSGHRYGSDPTPQHYPSFSTIPNYNNFHTAAQQGVTVFGGVHTSSQSGTLRSRGGTGEDHISLFIWASKDKVTLTLGYVAVIKRGSNYKWSK